MQPFTRLEGVAAPVDIPNCDTDQIIPARFLRHLPGDSDYRRFLFHDLRYGADGTERADFVLKRPGFRDARILVADVNWGCGSSRENAVYALVANDIRCVIAPSFGDIHYGNCTKHGVLPVRLARETCDAMRRALHARPGATITVDLQARTVTGPDGAVHAFAIDDFDRTRLLEGLDDIGLTMKYADRIESFEQAHRQRHDWLEA